MCVCVCCTFILRHLLIFQCPMWESSTNKQLRTNECVVSNYKSCPPSNFYICIISFYVANWTKSRIDRSLSGHKRYKNWNKSIFESPRSNIDCCCRRRRFFCFQLVFEKGNFHVVLVASSPVCVYVIAPWCAKCKWFELAHTHTQRHSNWDKEREKKNKKGPYKVLH